MAGITRNCALELENIGALSCTKNNPFLDTVSLIIMAAGTTFESVVDFANIAAHQGMIRNKKEFPIHEIYEITDKSEEALYYESPTGMRLPRRLGKYRNVYHFNKSLQVHKALQSFRNANVDVFMVDSAGIISGWSPDGEQVRGFSVAMFNVEKMIQATQDNKPAWTPIAVDQLDAKEWNEKGVSVKLGWNVNDLVAVTQVKLTYISGTATAMALNVSYFDGYSEDGSENLIGITGILQSDFVPSAATLGGPVPVITSMTDVGNGNYTFIGTGLTAGLIGLAHPSEAETLGDPIEAVPIALAD